MKKRVLMPVLGFGSILCLSAALYASASGDGQQGAAHVPSLKNLAIRSVARQVRQGVNIGELPGELQDKVAEYNAKQQQLSKRMVDVLIEGITKCPGKARLDSMVEPRRIVSVETCNNWKQEVVGIVQEGLDVDHLNNALVKAIFVGVTRPAVVEAFIEVTGMKNLNMFSIESGTTPLEMAVAVRENLDMVKFIIEKRGGRCAIGQDEINKLLLGAAQSSTNVKMVKYFIQEMGAEAFYTDESGFNAFVYAKQDLNRIMQDPELQEDQDLLKEYTQGKLEVVRYLQEVMQQPAVGRSIRCNDEREAPARHGPAARDYTCSVS